MTPGRARLTDIAVLAGITLCLAPLLAAAILGSLALGGWTDGPAVFWPPNAIALCALLLLPRRRWPAVVAAVLLSSTGVDLALDGRNWPLSFAYGVINASQVYIAGRFLSARGQQLDLESLAGLGRFVFAATVGGMWGAVWASLSAFVWLGDPIMLTAHDWFLSDLLGLLIVTPTLLIGWTAWRRSLLLPSRDLRNGGIALAGLVVVSAIVFAQARWPLSFVLVPLVMHVTYWLRGFGAAGAACILAVIGTVAIGMDTGPFALVRGSDEERVLVFQLFLALTILSNLALAAVLGERDRLSAGLRHSEREFRTVVDAVSDVIFRTDYHGRWTFLNPAWETLTGFSTAESLGRSYLSQVVAEDRAMVLNRAQGMDAGLFDSLRMQLRFRRRDGGQRWVEVNSHALRNAAGDVTGTAGTIVDISDRVALAAHADEARRRAEREAEAARLLAATDDLTGLASRRAFLDLLGRALAEQADGGREEGADHDGAARARPGLAIALFDIDYFKQVNDRFGHLAGDDVLRAIARVARRSVRDNDVVGRLGGEEFAVLMPGATLAQAVAVGERLRAACAAEAHPACPGLTVTVSLGVTVARPGIDTTGLLREADAALYAAKNAGRNCLRSAA
jgi:diguanylate cyclase (GGDEF)-like protein/PAS domain S-box-containing protein